MTENSTKHLHAPLDGTPSCQLCHTPLDGTPSCAFYRSREDVHMRRLHGNSDTIIHHGHSISNGLSLAPESPSPGHITNLSSSCIVYRASTPLHSMGRLVFCLAYLTGTHALTIRPWQAWVPAVPTRHSREHHISPHFAQLGKFDPARLHVMHTHGTRKREVRSSSSRGLDPGSSCARTECVRGVAGASDDDAVSSESIDGVGLGERPRVKKRVGERCSETLEMVRGRLAGEAFEGARELDEALGLLLVPAEWSRKVRVGAREGRSSIGSPLIKDRRESRAEAR